MKRCVWLWSLCGFAFVSLCGTLLHFLYEWTGESAWAAPFSGVNESTFEHMKLLFWPCFILAIVESFFFRDYKSFWCVKLFGTLIGLIAIPLIFYTYNGVIGKSPDFVNIAIFFISAAVAFIYEWRTLTNDEMKGCNQNRALLSFIIIAALFAVFTFNPPHLALFCDPITGKYGVQ